MEAIKFLENHLLLLDQTKLPITLEYVTCNDFQSVAEAIKTMKVRGAPAIGVSAAYGLVLAAYQYQDLREPEFSAKLQEAANTLKGTRPTAVNLFWAIKRMQKIIAKTELSVQEKVELLKKEAQIIQEEDLAMNIQMGKYGAEIIPENCNILTHCNAGALATAGFGTALGVIRAAHQQGKVQKVFVDETRPLLQGSRLTAFELLEDGLEVVLITDNMAAHFMQKAEIDCVIVGADRIAANGDVANKIGTYGLAVAAYYHDIPFYVAAPSSTLDLSLKTGGDIPIEERNPDEVKKIGDVLIAPENVKAKNPAFDITPNKLITAIITDQGIIRPDFQENLQRMFADEPS